MRPPGYEPGELPTAPLRDINHRNQINNRSISELRVQRYDFLARPPNVFAIIFQTIAKNTLLAPHQLPKPSIFDYFPLKFEKFVVAQSIQLTQQFESFFGESTGFQKPFIILPPVE